MKNASESREALLIAAADAFADGFGGVLEIQPDGLDPFYIDGRGDTAQPTPTRPAEPDCVWRSPPATLLSVFQRKRALENAYLSGRLAIGGDMSVMARLVLKGR